MQTRWKTGVALAVVLTLGVVLTMLARDGLALERHLTDARVDLDAFRAAAANGDADAARAAAQDARDDVALARTRVDGPLWTVAGLLPRYGATARAGRGVVDLADATAALSVAIAEDAAALIADGAGAFIADGQVRTDELVRLADRLEGLPVGPLTAARDELSALPLAGLVGPVAALRDEAVTAADDALTSVDRARAGLGAFAGFLGADGPRAYLLAIQNPGELRGTGGLISYVAELTIDRGRISLSGGATIGDDLDDPLARTAEGENSPTNLEPVDRPAEFAARYDHNAGGGLLQSVNLDPDLPTVGQVLLDLYAARGGRPLDGAILVDPLALAGITAATGGPIPVPAELRPDAAGFPTALDRANLAQTLLVTTYDAFGGLNPARRLFDEYVTGTALDRLTGGDWEPAALASALADAAAQRHLQLFSTDADEQAVFERIGIAGQLTATDAGPDVLAVTASNAAANKADVHVAHRITAAIELHQAVVPDRLVRRLVIEPSVENPLVPGQHDPYITGSVPSVPIGSGAPPRTDNALVRTWFSVWTPPATQLNDVRDGVNGKAIRYSNIHGHRAFDYFLETPSATTTSFSIDVSGEVQLGSLGRDRVYELVLWRQAKAIPDHWDLTITPPSGWTVVSAEVAGGGAPEGMGAGGSGGSAMAATLAADGTVRVDGAVTRDATIRLVMRVP